MEVKEFFSLLDAVRYDSSVDEINPELRGVLKTAGFLTRDSRVVERKKAGLIKGLL